MFKKIFLAIVLLTSSLVASALAVTDVYVKPDNQSASNLDYRFTYDNSSVVEFLTTRLYCGAIYLFQSSSCYEKATSTTNAGSINTLVNNQENQISPAVTNASSASYTPPSQSQPVTYANAMLYL